MAYMVMVELVETRAQSAFIAAATAVAMGADKIKPVPPHEARESFDEWLYSDIEEEQTQDPVRAVLIEALFPDRG